MVELLHTMFEQAAPFVVGHLILTTLCAFAHNTPSAHEEKKLLTMQCVLKRRRFSSR